MCSYSRVMLSVCLIWWLFGGTGAAVAQTARHDAVFQAAQAQQPKVLSTLESLVNIESGSRNMAGLAALRDVVAQRMHELGMRVEVVPPTAGTSTDARPLGAMVRGRLQGTGRLKIALIAHMDTVYPEGMLSRQPFRVDGDRVYGLGIADDKAGIAVVLHTVALLQTLGFRDYGELTVLINADEEIGSPGSKATLIDLGRDNDVVLSFEGSGIERDYVRLATSAIASVKLKVTGRASHAGASPERGRNAFYELAHQVLQTRDFSRPADGLKFNWTIGRAGEVQNVIPDAAEALGDARALRVEDFDGLEQRLRTAIQTRLIPDTQIDLTFTRGRPPLSPTPLSRDVALKAVQVAKEIDRKLEIVDQALGGGTDAAYAAAAKHAAVIESFGLQGYGAHSSNDEYVLKSSIVPRLYITTRLIQDLSALPGR